MRSTPAARQRSVPVAFALIIAVIAGVFGVAAQGAEAHPDALGHEHDAGPAGLPTAAQVAFHDQMRKLWEDHVTWTRLAIVTFAAGSAGLDATETRLLQNQTDIGNAIAPFYGAAAGQQLSTLLHTHITQAVSLLQDVKSGDTAAFAADKAAWYDNADQIADFLAAANPRFWPDAVMREFMKVHLDETLTEAADELGGNYTASVGDYEPVVQHMLAFADLLSSGIMSQFPDKFA
jgi:hypothetical protein